MGTDDSFSTNFDHNKSRRYYTGRWPKPNVISDQTYRRKSGMRQSRFALSFALLTCLFGLTACQPSSSSDSSKVAATSPSPTVEAATPVPAPETSPTPSEVKTSP